MKSAAKPVQRAGGREVQNPSPLGNQKRKNSVHRTVFRVLLVAEMGFEPHDLRVMSPASYQTAPLRDMKLVPEAGVEPVRDKISRDFKSRASANSAIPANATVCSYTLLNYYSTLAIKCQVLFIKMSKKFSKNIDKSHKM